MFNVPFRALAGALALALIAPAVPASPAPPSAVTVRIDNFTFGPSALAVPPGTTVTWINQDDIPHTIVSSDGGKSFRSKVLDTGDRFSFTFARAGRFGYFCSIHPHMTGTVLVKPR